MSELTADHQQNVRDDGQMWKYFAPMLHMDDDDLDPYEYRLLGHYRRVCGMNGGTCTESTRTTADKTHMSIGKVSQARQQLAKLKRITLRSTKSTIHVTLRDCWKANILRYSACSPHEQPTPDADECSPDEQPCSPDEQSAKKSCSPGEPKNNKKQPGEEQQEQTPPPLLLPEKAQTQGSPVPDSPNADVGMPCVTSVPDAPETGQGLDSPPHCDGEGTEEGDIFTFYADNIGNLTPHMRDELTDAITDYGPDEVTHAMREAVTHNKRSWAYCLAVMNRRKKNPDITPEIYVTRTLPPVGAQRAAPNVPQPHRVSHPWRESQTIHDAWDMAIRQLALQLDQMNVSRFIQPLTLTDYQVDTHTFVVTAPNPYIQGMCQSRLYRNIQRVLSDVSGFKFDETRLEFILPTQEAAA